MSRFKKALKEYLGADLVNAGITHSINWDMVDDEARERLLSLGVDEEENAYISALDAEKAGLSHVLEPFSWVYEGHERKAVLEHLLKKAPYYLIMAHNCRWNGASGYTVVDSIENVLDRGYDVSISPLGVSKGGKCLVCREASHDVPMGARTSIVALTRREYSLIENRYSWNDVEAFVRKYEDAVI